MKKLNLLLLGILFCAFALNSNAQSDTYIVETDWWPININCDGVQDRISGTQYCHVVDHYNPKTGVLEWYKNFWSAELVSEITGEVFSVNFHHGGKTDGDFRIDPPNWGGDTYFTVRFNARGDMGSHYLVTEILFYDFSTGTMNTIKRTVKCL